MGIACITGASSGIGREFARVLSNLGFNLILVGRNITKLNETREALLKYHPELKIKCITCDFTNVEAVKKLGDRLKQYDLDILINNAGFGNLSAFADADLEKDIDMINVNISALHILTRKVLPNLIAKDSGFIMNVASSAGLLPAGPFMSTYYATKAYVTSLTTAIHQELKEIGSNVHVCMLCPGPVDTNFNTVANVKFSLKGIPADYCAIYALRQMYSRKLTIIPTFTMKVATLGARFLPRELAAMITGIQQKKKG